MPAPASAAPDSLAALQRQGFGGRLWRVTGGLPNAQFRITDLRVDPEDPAFILATVDGSGYYVSHDGGGSWAIGRSPKGGLSESAIWDHAHHRDIFVAGDHGLARSTDDGRTWTLVTDNIGDVSITGSVIDFHIAGEVWRSSLPDVSWQHIPIIGAVGNGISYEWRHDGRETILATGGDKRSAKAVLYRKDGDGDFAPTSFLYDKAKQIESFLAIPNSATIFVAAVGIWRSDDAGMSWRRLSPVGHREGGLTRQDDPQAVCCPLISDLALLQLDNGQQVLVGAGRIGISLSTDLAVHWVALPGGEAFPNLPSFDHTVVAPMADGLHFASDIRSALATNTIPGLHARLIEPDATAPPETHWLASLLLVAGGICALGMVGLVLIRLRRRRSVP